MVTALPLKIHPDPILHQTSRPLTAAEVTSPTIARLILDIEKTMKEHQGIGLAAVQVGQLVRLVLIATKDGSLALLNPAITSYSWKKETGEEGCLSIPNTYAQVKRSVRIKVKALDAKGKPLRFSAEGLFARVIQHEVDHTNGILITDRSKAVTTADQPANGRKR
ncbi:MAG: peptide deformylase [Candidatus Buchananbacteria bacterium RIFCSPLOWO2_01_FULL_56_15]|uniref:Peptide deformylase n=2 Tax=Candidatus Buchananiibacteriota TaxID=1817903 RepID=A0A1G1YHN4_9BACT|nr:MAG: peptide deformylase [Candidatus Buchananbacteria bacterium RIFCSPHIGHO2_02_FULL_56_16]OGY55013.1 MAG: peptide deformylase [Candidatus Buchananbacteria bacterium RIFCSPLOWO2_01_FULL_56_15]HLA38630.1 peptide deformylase [Candidatus Glassbacteria bacterium]